MSQRQAVCNVHGSPRHCLFFLLSGPVHRVVGCEVPTLHWPWSLDTGSQGPGGRTLCWLGITGGCCTAWLCRAGGLRSLWSPPPGTSPFNAQSCVWGPPATCGSLGLAGPVEAAAGAGMPGHLPARATAQRSQLPSVSEAGLLPCLCHRLRSHRWRGFKACVVGWRQRVQEVPVPQHVPCAPPHSHGPS